MWRASCFALALLLTFRAASPAVSHALPLLRPALRGGGDLSSSRPTGSDRKAGQLRDPAEGGVESETTDPPPGYAEAVGAVSPRPSFLWGWARRATRATLSCFPIVEEEEEEVAEAPQWGGGRTLPMDLSETFAGSAGPEETLGGVHREKTFLAEELAMVELSIKGKETKQGHPAEPVPVFAAGGSSTNLPEPPETTLAPESARADGDSGLSLTNTAQGDGGLGSSSANEADEARGDEALVGKRTEEDAGADAAAAARVNPNP